MKKIASILLISLFSLLLWAENFTVDSYDINLDVKEDQSIVIKETINVDFSSPSHGIYRDIQYRFSNPNGNFADPIKAKVNLISSSSPYSIEKEDGFYRIYLGDEDNYVSGKESYTIEYTYTLNKDVSDEYDELYYNIVSPAWDTLINDISWSVTLPKAIDKNRVWVTIGENGSTKKGNYTISLDKKQISGYEDGLINKGAITLRVEMDEGYWLINKKVDESNKYLVIASVVSLLLLCLSFVLWYLYGRDLPLKKEKREKLSEEITPLQFSYILDQTIKDNREFPAMLFYWAGKGYVRIEETEEDGKKSYVIDKLKDLPTSSSKSERELFSLVFFKDSVTLKDLAYSDFTTKFYDKVQKALREEYSTGEKRLTNKKSYIMQNIVLIALLALTVFDGIFVSMKYPGILSLTYSLIFLAVFIVSTLIGSFWQTRSHIWSGKKKITVATLLTLTSLIAIVVSLFIAKKTLLNFPLVCFSLLSVVLTITLGSFIACHIEQRSAYGHKILEECLGLREYIITSKKNELEEKKDEYSSLMPYALVIDEGKNWSDKFDSEDLSNPTWFVCNSNYPFWIIWYSLYSSMTQSYQTSYEEHVASSPSSSSGFSGVAGGGFSGGGGGSW